MAVCGSFDRDAVIAAARTLPMPLDPAVPLTSPAWGTAKELDITLKGRRQAHLLLVFPTVPVDSEDEAGLELLQTILSGQSGLLFRDLRDRQGLGYVVTAFTLRLERAGAMVLYIGTEPGKMTQAEEGFRKIIAELRTGLLPEAELDRGKNRMLGEYNRDRQTLSARSEEAATLVAAARPLDAEKALTQKAASLTPEELRTIAAKYLDMDRAYTVKVLP
jgi:zinc protease